MATALKPILFTWITNLSEEETESLVENLKKAIVYIEGDAENVQPNQT